MALAFASLDSPAYSAIFLHALLHVPAMDSVSRLGLKWRVCAMKGTKATIVPKNLASMIAVVMVNALMGLVHVKMAGAMPTVHLVVLEKVPTAAVTGSVLRGSVFAILVGLVMLVISEPVWRTAISMDSVTTELVFARTATEEAIVQFRAITSLVSVQSIVCEVVCSNAITHMTHKEQKLHMNATTCAPKNVSRNASQGRCQLISVVARLVFPQLQ